MWKSDNILCEFSNQKFTTGHLTGHGTRLVLNFFANLLLKKIIA